mgnify:CR=1 FL=1
MHYTGNKKRVSARITIDILQWAHEEGLVVNRFFNRAMESLIYELDHERIPIKTVRMLQDKNTRQSGPVPTKAIQLKIERMFIEKLDMGGYVLNRTLQYAALRFLLRWKNGDVPDYEQRYLQGVLR